MAHRPRLFLTAAAIVLIVLSILFASLYAEHFPPFSESKAPSAPVISSNNATALALARAHNFSSGSWSLFEADTIGSHGNWNVTAELPPVFQPGALLGCPESTSSNLSQASLAAGANPANISSGLSSMWLIWLQNSSGELLGLAVSSHGATILGTLTRQCIISLGWANQTAIIGFPVDSGKAAVLAYNSAAVAFAARYPIDQVYYTLAGGTVLANGTTEPALWQIQYSSCPTAPLSSSQSTPTLWQKLNATSGAFFGSSIVMWTC
jgi:hypothetical protein